MEFALSNLPLSLLEAINPDVSLRGQASADLSLQGASQNPEGRFELRLSEVRQQQERELGRLPELAGRITASLQDRQLRLEGDISGFAEEPLNLRGNLPVQLSLSPFAFEVPETAPLDAELTWSGNIENVVGLFPVDSIRLTGNGEVDITLGGTLGEPDLGGRIELSNAVYENFVSGTLLQPLNLMIEGRQDRLEITELQASDGGDGEFTGQGSIQFREGEELISDISLEFSNMGFVHRDDVTAHLSGNLSLQGDLLGRSEVSGEIRNESIEIRLVNELPPSVSELNNVIILGQDDGDEESQDEDANEEDDTTADSGPVMALNIEINLPRRVFVRGRGLDSEWAGQFSVKGTASSPQVTGSLEPQRGSFSIAGKSFQLQEGSVSLPPGNDLNPVLDLSAAAQAGDIQAIIRVTGSASEPRIDLTSNPTLPEDEVLSRVLFDKNSSRLSPGEALMLANTAATLTSGGPGITDIARNLLGADVVSFTPSEEEDEGLGSVTIGRYLAEGVYVGVEQGTQAGSTELDVELDVTDNIKVNSQTGTDGGSQVGIRWQWDY
ncbi:translocation/assembly module TamB domain-containing protein [Fodinicurvata halophila]